jgi:hypothetical protein
VKNGAVGKSVVAGDGVYGLAVAVNGGLGAVGGDLWWLGGGGGVCEQWRTGGVKGKCEGQVKVMGERRGKVT